jgi:hypothetical protein
MILIENIFGYFHLSDENLGYTVDLLKGIIPAHH